jgi:hypothetical protein
MGPVAAKSYAGRQLLRVEGTGAKALPAPPAKQEADYGRRGHGYIFGYGLLPSAKQRLEPLDGRPGSKLPLPASGRGQGGEVKPV